MSDAAPPVLQVIEAGNEHPLNLYADDDLAALILWLILNRPLLGIKKSYQIVIDVGREDIAGKVNVTLPRMKRAA